MAQRPSMACVCVHLNTHKETHKETHTFYRAHKSGVRGLVQKRLMAIAFFFICDFLCIYKVHKSGVCGLVQKRLMAIFESAMDAFVFFDINGT